MNHNPELIITDDGSSSLYVKALDETYHSRKGAVAESQHVFVNHGLLAAAIGSNEIDVFELGFGTGLNALLTWKAALDKNIKVNYYAIEKYPLNATNIESLNYGKLLDGNGCGHFKKLHGATWGEWTLLDEHFSLYKHHADIDEVTDIEGFDLVYYDAFGPKVQHNMWTTEKLAIVHQVLKKRGVLVTYCAQGQFRRNLKFLGFEVERLPGPPHKREMTRATKT